MSAPADPSAVRWLVTGLVQGVGFRWFVARRAISRGLSGWARNLPDGRVEVVAAGSRQALAELEEALQVGPTLSHVENVEKAEIPHEDVDTMSFEIR